MLAEIRELGFEYAELSHAIRLSLVDGIQTAVKAGEIKISSLHNFCPLPLSVTGPAPDYYRPSSRNVSEHELAIRQTLRTLDFAASLGAPVVVLHLGTVEMRRYTEKLLLLIEQNRGASPKFARVRAKALASRAKKCTKYFEQVLRALDVIVPHARQLNIRLGLETRLGIEQIPSEDEIGELIKRYSPEAVAYWHDIGHAATKELFGLAGHETLLERYRGQTAGIHLQDFAPPGFDHQPPGFGTFDFTRLQPFLTREMSLVWEIHSHWTTAQVQQACLKTQEMLRVPATTL